MAGRHRRAGSPDADSRRPAGSPSARSRRGCCPRSTRIVARHRGKRIVVVSHITPIKTVLRTCLSAPQETMFKFHLDTASLSVIDYYEDGTTSVRTINNSEHPAEAS